MKIPCRLFAGFLLLVAQQGLSQSTTANTFLKADCPKSQHQTSFPSCQKDLFTNSSNQPSSQPIVSTIDQLGNPDPSKSPQSYSRISMDPPEVAPTPPPEAIVHTLFEQSTGTYQWMVACPETKHAIIIDPVLDSKTRSSQSGISTTAADRILGIIKGRQYTVVRILETHSHQKSTSAWYLRGQLDQITGCMPRIDTGKSIMGVQRMFRRQYRIQDAFQSSRFDTGFKDNETFEFGKLQCRVLLFSSPTQEIKQFGFVIGSNVFCGTVDGAAAGAVSQRLSVLPPGCIVHPNDSRPSTVTETDSRPASSRTEVSTWQHSPIELRRPSMDPDMVQNYSRPRSQNHEIGA